MTIGTGPILLCLSISSTWFPGNLRCNPSRWSSFTREGRINIQHGLSNKKYTAFKRLWAVVQVVQVQLAVFLGAVIFFDRKGFGSTSFGMILFGRKFLGWSSLGLLGWFLLGACDSQRQCVRHDRWFFINVFFFQWDFLENQRFKPVCTSFWLLSGIWPFWWRRVSYSNPFTTIGNGVWKITPISRTTDGIYIYTCLPPQKNRVNLLPPETSMSFLNK